MITQEFLLHYGNIGFIVGTTSLGAGIGAGLASYSAVKAISRAPSSQQDISKALFIGLALIETAAILTLVVALLLLSPQVHVIMEGSIARAGIACALGFTGLLIGILSAFPVQQAVYAIARQPFFSTHILNLMLLTQSIIQTPVIFAFLISLIISFQASSVTNMPNALRLLCSGLCIGLGSLGPSIGLGLFAQQACKGLGFNRLSYNNILPFTFISQAIIETPIIFSLLISLVIISLPLAPTENPATLIALVAAAVCMGFGTLGPGIASGKTAAQACKTIAEHPEHYSLISKASMLGQGLIDSSAGYALLIALLLIIFR